MLKRLWAAMVAVAVILCIAAVSAESDPSIMSVNIYKTNWKWKAGEGGAVTFEGNMICENVSEDHPVIMRLSVDVAKPETEAASPVFKIVNEKNQGNRHPPKEVTISSSEQAIRFSGYWTLPEDTRIDEATIHLRVYNQEEELLTEAELLLKNDQMVVGKSGYRFPETGNLIKIIAGAAAVIWILAVIRIIRNRKRR